MPDATSLTAPAAHVREPARDPGRGPAALPAAGDITASTRHTHIGPDGGWLIDVREVWKFRELLGTLALRDLKVRYKQTVLGVAWVVLQPLVTALIFSFVFGRVLRISFPGGIPPLLFIFAALTGYYLFRDIVNRSSTALVANRALVSKIYFPRILLPASAVLNSLVDFAVGVGVFVSIWAILGLQADPAGGANIPVPGWHLLLWPVCTLLLVMISLGIGMAATAMAVSWRDVAHVIPVVLMIAMYASPVMYDIGNVLTDDISRPYQALYFANPLAGLLAAYRYALLGAGTVSWAAFAYSAAFAVVVLIAGALIFKRMERRFADVI